MQGTQHPLGRLRFGVFELDLRAGELRKYGLRVRLQEQPFQVLAMLLEHPGGGTKEQGALQIGEKEKEYPEPTMFGTTPAHGLMIRHAEGVEASDFKVVARAREARPCVIVDDAAHDAGRAPLCP